MKLKDKIALITGGSSGIGLATAQLFAKEGARVIIVGRSQAALSGAIKQIGQGGMAIKADITNLADLDRLFAEIKKVHGRLDIVFANAGVLRINRLADITSSEYDDVFDASVKGTIFTVQKALPVLSDGASIILNSAAIAGQGVQGLALNAAAKAAVRSLARTFTTELKDRHIRVNAVSPGTIATPLLDNAGMTLAKAGSIIGDSPAIPAGRVGTPEELAAAVLFLASDDSSYITGIDLAVDGGQAQV